MVLEDYFIAIAGALLLAFCTLPVSLADEQPIPLRGGESSNTLPLELFKGHVNNQAEKYVLGPGDSISIKIKDLSQFNQDFVIRPDGYATIQPFGESYLSGVDLQGLQTWLEEKFKYYLVKPQVTVNITEMRPALIYVAGGVTHPGAYQFSRNTLNTLTVQQSVPEKAQITLSNVLNKAGGVSIRADISRIQIVHAITGQKEEFNLRDLLEGNGVADRWLLSEDKVIVPEMDHPMDHDTFHLISRSTFFQGKFPVVVLGAVHHQGEVQIDPNNNNLNSAIGLAGGFIDGVSKQNKVILERPLGNGRFNRRWVSRKQTVLTLEPGDVVYVPDSKLALLGRGLQLWSSIAQPTFYTTNSLNTITKSLVVPIK